MPTTFLSILVFQYKPCTQGDISVMVWLRSKIRRCVFGVYAYFRLYWLSPLNFLCLLDSLHRITMYNVLQSIR